MASDATRRIALEELARIGTWEWDVATDVVTWSDEMYRIFGLEPETFEATFEAYLARLHPDDRGAARVTVEHALGEAQGYAADYRVVCDDGAQRWVHCRGRAETDASGAVIRLLGTTQDITERKEREQHLVHQALHDPLTGLPNRSLLLDRLAHSMQRTARTRHSAAVYFVDLDRFKNVNDSNGHAAGDNALRAVAQRLCRAVRQHDTVARIGGDEFVVIAEDLDWPNEAMEIGRRLLRAVAVPIVFESTDLVVTASVGATLADAHADPTAVLRDTDAAMYEAKRRGGHTVVWTDG